jgi:hypothetical protein
MEQLKELAKNANQESKAKEIKAIQDKANAKTPTEKLKALVKVTLTLFLGKGGEFMTDEFFSVLKTITK